MPAAGAGGAPARDPDRDHPQLAAAPLARGDPLADLGGVEADGQVGIHRLALDLASGRVDPGGDVAGDHGRVAAVDRGDRGSRRFARGAGEAGAEDRVDDRA